MARRFLAAALVIALAPVDLAFAQTGVAAAAAPGTIRESINREVAKPMLVNVSTVAPRSARLGTAFEATARPISNWRGRSFMDLSSSRPLLPSARSLDCSAADISG
jgi:hypothetical protein